LYHFICSQDNTMK